MAPTKQEKEHLIGNETTRIRQLLWSSVSALVLLVIALFVAGLSDSTIAVWSFPIGCAALISTGLSAFRWGQGASRK